MSTISNFSIHSREEIIRTAIDDGEESTLKLFHNMRDEIENIRNAAEKKHREDNELIKRLCGLISNPNTHFLPF